MNRSNAYPLFVIEVGRGTFGAYHTASDDDDIHSSFNIIEWTDEPYQLQVDDNVTVQGIYGALDAGTYVCREASTGTSKLAPPPTGIILMKLAILISLD